MKLVKLSVFALTMGLFVASCGNGEAKKDGADTTMKAPEVAPTPTPAPPVADTTKPATTPEATPAAPATEPKKDEKKK